MRALSRKRILIVDLDGTLFDTSTRWRLCQEESKNKREFWECYLSPKYMHLDEPNWRVVDFVRRKMAEGYEIVFATGRSLSQREETLSQLARLGLPPVVYFKPEEHKFKKSAEFKRELACSLASAGAEVIVVDDEPIDLGNCGAWISPQEL